MNPLPESTGELSPTKRALLALQHLQSKLEALELAQHEPIAIIGIGCRFPGGVDSPESFWQLLQSGKHAITEIPSDRWNVDAYYHGDPAQPGAIVSRWGGFVPHLYEFDASFFRIAPREAVSLDPQQRLLLEVSWEALEHASLAPDQLMGSLTGVFVGICGIDYWQQLLRRNPKEIDAYLTTGNTHSTASGRLSYTYGCTGPSLSIDAACASSLVAVHLACQSLRQRECHLALAGGVNRILSPETSINFSKAQMLSPTGQCKAFDATADGFVRSEGCGILILKRLSDAIRDGETILAVILGSAVNHDGRTSGMTVPNGPAQQALIRQALQNSRVEPAQISYLETHGTGTALGDPIEVGALGALFSSTHAHPHPLILGSVKTNIGHTEAAAGMASLIKTVLALRHQAIPPNLHFHTPNPHIAWQELPVKVPTTLLAWDSDQPRIAGVSAFGFNGTNAHVVVADAPPSGWPTAIAQFNPSQAISPQSEHSWHLFTLSAKTAAALQQLVERYKRYLASHPELEIAAVCYTVNIGRSHFSHRLAIVTSSMAELCQQLAAVSAGQAIARVFQGRISRDSSQSPEQLPTLASAGDWLTLLEQRAALYVQGAAIETLQVDQVPLRRLIGLPTYPFQRQYYGLGAH